MKGNTLQTLCSSALRSLKRNSPTILTIGAIIGLGFTSVTVATGTLKAQKRLEKAKEEKGEDLTTFEVVKTAAPAYIPSVAIGLSTVACMLGANALNKRNQAALASAYALVDNGFKEYRNKVKEMLGEDVDEQIRDAIARDKCKQVYINTYGGLSSSESLPTDGDAVLFYEEYRNAYFESTIEAVRNAEYHFNRNFTMRGYANLNEFYEFLGLEPTKEGELLGWDITMLLEGYDTPWIDFDHRKVPVTDDGLECYIISMPIPPSIGYEE